MGKITKLANIVAKAARVHKKAMIIDEILERKEGMPYNSKDFYDYVSYWAETDNDVGTGIARALDGGTEEDVKRELCKYIKEQGYNPEICDYINSVNWLEERNDQNVIVGNAFPNEAKRIEDLLKQNNIEYQTSKKGKNIYFEIMFNGKDVWTVNDILNAVLEDRSKFQLVKRANINKKAKHLKQVRKRAGYSNNPNYFGDWFGEGQIDFSQIINPNDSGDVYMVKMWGGSGYILDVYLVKAQDDFEAIDKVFEWSYENEGANKLVFDYEDIDKEAAEYYKDEPDMFGKEMSEEDFIDRFMEEFYVANSDYSLFAREENFFVGKVPEKYLKGNKESSKKIKLHKKAAAMTKEEILEDIFQNNIEFDDESKEARLTEDKGRLVEIFELSEKEEDLRKQFDKYVEENDLLDDKYYYFEKNEQAKEEDAYLDSYDYLYSLLVNGNISLYKERLANMTGKEIVQYINWADEMGIDKAKLRLNYIESSKRVKLTKKANYTLTDLVKEDIENIEMCLENIQTTYANALLTKLSMELQERLDNSIVESDLRDLFEVK